jgi:transposase-like protein
MRPYSEAVKADVRRRMGPPHRQSVAEISQQLGIHVITLYKWLKGWRLQGGVVPASQKDPEGWSPADKFTVVLETTGLNTTKLNGYCRERGLFSEQVNRWRQAAQDANAQPLLTMAYQKDLQKRHQEDQREIKRLQQELRRKDKALAVGGGVDDRLRKDPGLLGRGRGGLTGSADRRQALEILDAAVAARARAQEVAALLGVGPHNPATLAAAVRG